MLLKHIFRKEGKKVFAVEMRGVTKRFGNFAANDHIDLLVKKGEIHCLLGENGAGKTTLMNILFGIYQADEGKLLVNGEILNDHSASKAYHLGLGMVHQHFMLVDALSVWENVVLGKEPGGLRIDRKEGVRSVQELADRYHFDLQVTDLVGSLSVGMKQRVEILKTLYRGAEIVILDEPTAVLSPPEVIQLLDILQDLKKEGKTVIFITHKLNETKAISDQVTVLRGGKTIASVATKDVSIEELAGMMVGHEVSFTVNREKTNVGDVILQLNGVRLLPNARETVSFSIRAGEVLGIAGVEGNGQKQLEEIILGLKKCHEGQILFLGQDVTKWSTKKRLSQGISYIPSDRYERAILPSFSLEDNYLLGNQFGEPYVRANFIQKKILKHKSKELMQSYDVRATSSKQAVGSLSGGNQQKMVLSREVGKDAPLVIACQPVRGLDIGAIQYIHQVLLELRRKGKAILLISAELTDIRQLSDNIAVLYKGELMGLQKNEDLNTETIGLLMAGRRINKGGRG
ncbi:MAG: ABC transporter ATP-binding protein [Eubacteriales bacterium]|nr:ABC transporter ATP-binding protein [Eubacteriales bacterium]